MKLKVQKWGCYCSDSHRYWVAYLYLRGKVSFIWPPRFYYAKHCKPFTLGSL